MSLKQRLFADPFKGSEDDIDLTTEKGMEVASQPPATKWELWTYYLYYDGNNGYTTYNYMPTILQYLAYRGGFIPGQPNVKCNLADMTSPCNVTWLNSKGGIPVASMTLYVQAIAFSIQFLLFTSFGSLADYGRWNRHILLLFTVIAIATQILPITLVKDNGSHWGVMMAIMVVGLISYGATLVFYGAAFPVLSDNLPVVRQARADPKLPREESEKVVEKWRSHVSTISTVHSNIGYLLLTAILSGVSFIPYSSSLYNFPAGVNQIYGNVPEFNFVGTVVCGSFWLLTGIWYFIARPRGRQGRPLPEGANHFTLGWKSVILAVKEARKLKYLFMYIISYFMFSDAVNTTSSLIGIVQNELTSFSGNQNTILSLVAAISSILGCFLFLWLNKVFGMSTKTGLLWIIGLSAIVPLWGSVGIGVSNFGIKKSWELWVINIWSGLFTAPVWAWQQTMLADLTPKGKENLFFSLFGIVNKASSWIGPVVVGAIVQATGNNWNGFPFILGLFIVSMTIIYFIDVEKAKQDLVDYERLAKAVDEGDIAPTMMKNDTLSFTSDTKSIKSSNSIRQQAGQQGEFRKETAWKF